MAPPVTAEIYSLIDREFDVANTSLATFDNVHTGKWSRDQKLPAIAVYGEDGGPVDGGTTGATAFAGDGGFYQRFAGQCRVDCVAGTREDLEGAGSSGGDLNPKQVRFELYDEVRRILANFRPSTLRTVLPGDYEDFEATTVSEDVAPVYGRRVPARFTYDP